MLKNILKSTAIWMAATVSFTACEVDTTTVMFEEDHDFSQPGDTVFSVLVYWTRFKTWSKKECF